MTRVVTRRRLLGVADSRPDRLRTTDEAERDGCWDAFGGATPLTTASP
jgi:hypothetical protein